MARRALLGISIVLALAAAACVPPATPGTGAEAWERTASAWEKLFPRPDGSFYAVTNRSQDGTIPSTVQHVNQAGNIEWSVTTKGSVWAADLQVDAVGNAFWEEIGPTSGAWSLVSYSPSGVLRWHVAGGLYEIVVGSDSNVYSTLPGDSAAPTYVAKYSNTTGQLVWRTPLPPNSYNGRLSAYNGGIIDSTSRTIFYLSLDGRILSSVPNPEQADGTSPFKSGLSVEPNGEAYGMAFTSPAIGICAYNSDVTTAVEKFSPFGLEWQHILPPGNPADCANMPTLAPLPDGGVVTTTAPDGTIGGGLTILNADGTLRATLARPDARSFTPYQMYVPYVDVNGRIAMPGFHYVPCPDSTSDSSCKQVSIDVYTPQGELLGSTYVPRVFNNAQPDTGSISDDSIWASSGGRLDLILSYGTYGTAPTLLSLYVPWVARPYTLGASPSGRYVALGDSYSSGEGNAPFRQPPEDPFDTATDRCDRSDVAYPVVFARAHNLTYDFFACSGVQTYDMFASNKTEPPQFAWLRSDVNLVTLTVGGNNLEFPASLQDCLEAKINLDPGTQPQDCPNVLSSIAGHTTETLDQVTTYFYSLLAQRDSNGRNPLQEVYRQILQNAAPSARLVVLGYPRWFVQTPTSPCRVPSTTLNLSIVDQSWLDGWIQRLDKLISDSVAGYGTYIDTYDAFNGHEMCAAGSPDMIGLDLSHHGTFHPNANGQAALANALLSRL